VVVLDCLKPQRLAQFWAQALGYHPAPSSGPYVVLVPGAQPGPDLVLQRVPEPRAGKNRMHLDLRVPTLEPELARLTVLGAEALTPEPIDEDGFHLTRSVIATRSPRGACPAGTAALRLTTSAGGGGG